MKERLDIVSKINHENILKIHKYTIENNELRIYTEQCDNSLDKILKDNKGI